MTAVDSLLKKHFKVKDFNTVLLNIHKKEESFFMDNLFIDKATFMNNIQQLAIDINQLADTYKTAQEASKSGSVIQGFASAGFGAVQKEYIQKRKAMVHHVSLFATKK